MDDPNRHRRQNQNDPPIHNTPNPRYSLQEPSQQQRQQLQQHQQQQQHQHQHQPQQPAPQPQTPQQQQHLQHQQYQQSQPQPQHHQQQQRQSLIGTSAERLRPPPLNTGSAGASRTVGSSGGYGGYYPESGAAAFPGSIAQNALPYQSDYGQDNRQQTQGFGAYTPGMIYGVQTPSHSSVYDSSLFSARQQATPTSIIPSDVTASYSPFEPSSGTATGPGLPPQSQATSSVASVYQGAQLPSFTGGLPSVAGMSQQQQQQPGQGQGQGRAQQQRGQRQGPQQNHQQQQAGPPSADVSMAESTEHGPMTNGLEERWAVYLARIRNIFQDIQNGSLEQASEELLDVSNWIVSNVVDLGLHMDNQDLWSDRLGLWTDFNNAWLALLQRQKDMVSSGQQLPRGQSVLSKEAIDHMAREMIRLCDNIERHGLVDYQYGIWEERIMSAIIECADQFGTEDSAVSAEGSGSHN